MSTDTDADLPNDGDELPSLHEMYEELCELRDVVEDQQQTIDELESKNQLLERRLTSVADVVDEDGMAVAEEIVADYGGLVPWVETIANAAPNTSVSSHGAAARSAMLPIHKMWADVRDGDTDSLDKTQRRAAVLYGAFLRRACGQSPSEDSVLGYNGVDAGGQAYSITSTEAKRTLQECPYIDGTMYSATVKRAFEAVQRFSNREECECSTIERCGHGLVTMDASGGTNRMKTNKHRFHDALQDVQDAVLEVDVGSVGGSDDSVSPASGLDEDAADTEHTPNMSVRNGVEVDVSDELDRIVNRDGGQVGESQ